MARAPKGAADTGLSPERPAGEPIRDLYPTMDARFVLVEIGKLGSKVDRLVDDVHALTDRVDDIRHKISFMRGALWVLGGLMAAILVILGWYVSGRLSITFRPPP